MKSMMLMALLFVLLPPSQTADAQAASAIKLDVDELVHAAAKLTGTWPTQPPPPIHEVSIVARHGRAAVPLLVDLLSDDPATERDAERWKVQQQASLALCLIYSESTDCGRTYCDGDPPERIAQVRKGWLQVIASNTEMRALSVRELLDRFKKEQVFWRQLEIGRALAAVSDRGAVAELEAWLNHDDRHVRGNAAFVLGRLGEPRGFATIAAILVDRAPRTTGQGIPGGTWSLQAQIRSDRYYAAHLLGDLKDPRGVGLLISLMNDPDVSDIVPWSLGEIGDRRAIEPLVEQLRQDDPSRRVLTILALETLKARQALPRLRALLHDTRKSNFGERTSVTEAARHAIDVISPVP